MKIFKKNPAIALVLGTLLLVYAFLAYFKVADFLKITTTLGNIVIGIILILFATLITLPKIGKNKHGLSRTLRTLEFLLILLAGIFGFILPALNIDSINLGSGSLWLGLSLVIDGTISLYLVKNNQNTKNDLNFMLYIFMVIGGTYIYAKNYVEANIRLATFLIIVIMGLYLLIIGLSNTKKKK